MRCAQSSLLFQFAKVNNSQFLPQNQLKNKQRNYCVIQIPQINENRSVLRKRVNAIEKKGNQQTRQIQYTPHVENNQQFQPDKKAKKRDEIIIIIQRIIISEIFRKTNSIEIQTSNIRRPPSEKIQ
eukprot:TRINITY_DN4568_c1_g1_i4.p4 TRINITY_DN4568_c1_g1~~TRINITY_DN4568_c1_g1_i4.p4  ORF type:complete len:126 (-),score=1.53 TRINITY_DN4568_c1_g1_i4:389-766(-)